MKELLKRYEEAVKAANIADAAWEANPESAELEAAFDEAYEAEFKAFDELTNKIVEITNGQIEKALAATMVRSKMVELKQLIAKMA